jgi:hypothetical protein
MARKKQRWIHLDQISVTFLSCTRFTIGRPTYGGAGPVIWRMASRKERPWPAAEGRGQGLDDLRRRADIPKGRELFCKRHGHSRTASGERRLKFKVLLNEYHGNNKVNEF